MTPQGFRTPKQQHIAAQLRNSPMSASELREIVGGDRKTLKRSLESLREQGLLDYLALDTGPTAPGRPAGLWALSELGERYAQPASGTSRAVGSEDEERRGATVAIGGISQGHTLLEATVPPGRMTDLMAVLADGELIAATAWVARTNGDGQALLFAFNAYLGDQPIENLRAALEAIGLSITIRVVGSVQRPVELVDSMRVAQAAAERARTRRHASTS